jgi:hypothetical protein
MKTSELTGAALDWAVAKIEHPDLLWGSGIGVHHASHQIVIPHLPEPQCYWSPSTNWAQGGPIIERELIEIYPLCNVEWGARKVDSEGDLIRFYGDTPLIAAMRCYVAAKLGEIVDVPVEFLSDSQVA